MAARITSDAQARSAIKALSSEKMAILIAGLRLQHPELRRESDDKIRARLESYTGGPLA